VLAYDGITGAPVTGAAVTVRVGSHVLTATAASNAYTISNLPDGPLPIFAQATGYLAFAGIESATAAPGASTSEPTYTTQVIVMYADTQVPNDYTIKVYDNVTGAAVTGGEVILSSRGDAGNNVGASIPTTVRIAGSYDFRPLANVYPLTNGVATVPAADLIYGLTYNVDVVGATLGTTGKYLTQIYTTTTTTSGGVTTTTSPTLTAPTDPPIKVVFMSPVNVQPVVLTYSTAGTPKPITKDITAPLKITFAQPVEDCTNPTVFNMFSDSAADQSTATLTAPNAKMTISADGLTVTLTVPATSYSTAPVASIAEIVTYNAGFKVRVVGTVGDSTSTNCVSLTVAGVRGDTAVHIDPAVIVFQP
jgi:hypothetical protein